MKCTKCNLDLLSDEVIKCSNCHDKSHYSCVGLSNEDFKKILPMNMKKWKCPRCKQQKKPSTPTLNLPSSQLLLNETTNQNSDTSPSIVTIDTGALLSSMNSQFQQLSKDMADLKTGLNEKIDALAANMQIWSSKFQELELTVSTVQADMVAVKEENAALRSQLDHLQQSMDEQDQKARHCNIEIQNLPVKPSENLVHVTMALGKVLNVPITVESIQSVHRVAPNAPSNRPKNIVVELCSRRLRDQVIAAARARRGVTAGQVLGAGAAANTGGDAEADQRLDKLPIYINEHLTLKNKILHAKTRKEAAAKKYKWVWVKNSAILVRKNDSSTVIRIRSEDDLTRL